MLLQHPASAFDRLIHIFQSENQFLKGNLFTAFVIHVNNSHQATI